MSLLSDKDLALLSNWRQELHRHPELSGKEKATQQRIISFLQTHTKPVSIQKVGGHGVLAIFGNPENTGIDILVRGDIDALPIQETNTFEYRSSTSGISHKCGHDGHTTIIAALAIALTKRPLQKGRQLLLFQPAEETGEGAKAVLGDNSFHIHPTYAFALHNIPGYKQGEVLVRDGAFTPAVQSILFQLKGKTAHAAEPEKGVNPAGAIAGIIQAAEELQDDEISSATFGLITPVYSHLGSKDYGISAGEGEIHFTIRSWKNQRMEELTSLLIDKAQAITSQAGVKLDHSITAVFAANENDPEAVDFVRQAATENGYECSELTLPNRWGEDFGLFTQKFRGAMFGLGAGEDSPALHNPDYDFPDTLIGYGSAMFYRILEKATDV